jgi:hypothetical protein
VSPFARQWAILAASLRRNCRRHMAAISLGDFGLRMSSLNADRTRLAVIGGAFFSQPPALANQEPAAEQRAGCVMVPTLPGPHFVVVEARFALSELECLLDEVSLTGDSDEDIRGLFVRGFSVGGTDGRSVGPARDGTTAWSGRQKWWRDPVKRTLGFAAVPGEDRRVVGQGGGGYGCGERA